MLPSTHLPYIYNSATVVGGYRVCATFPQGKVVAAVRISEFGFIPKAALKENPKVVLQERSGSSVPMARGRHLFPCRTQKLSLVAVTILGSSSPGKIARCRIIEITILKGWFFFLSFIKEQYYGHRRSAIYDLRIVVCTVLGKFETIVYFW